MLEIKSDPDFIKDTAYRKKLVGIIISQVRSAGLAERTLLHSFDWDILAECQHQAPDIPVSFLTEFHQNQDEVGEDSAKDTHSVDERKRIRIQARVMHGAKPKKMPTLRVQSGRNGC